MSSGSRQVSAVGSDFRPDVVTQIALSAETPVVSSRQEGGAGVLGGTFCPLGSRVIVDVELSGLFLGWGAGALSFATGAVDDPPDPWEPGGKNRIVKADFENRTPLPGVRDFRNFQVGMLDANALTPHIARKIVLDGLEPGATYQWELRCGGMSFFKQWRFDDGTRPTAVAVRPDGLYAWVSAEGANKLALLQLGWSALWEKSGYSQEMLCVAEIGFIGAPGGIAPQPRPRPGAPGSAPVGPGRYLAAVDQGSDELVIVDQELLVIDGRYRLPDNATPSPWRVVWDRFGEAIYVGGSDGRLHRFDLAGRAFESAVDVHLSPEATVVPLDLQAPVDEPTADGRYLWCSSYLGGRLLRVDLADNTVLVVHSYEPGLAAPTCGAVRQRTGEILVVEDDAQQVRCFDAGGNVVSNWGSSMSRRSESPSAAYAASDAPLPARPPDGRRWSSICLDADEARAFWSHDGIFGWAWIDGAHEIDPETGLQERVINKGNLDVVYKTEFFGDIAVTADEGTLLAIPDEDTVIQWPGGAVTIRPAASTPGSWGAEHCAVTFTGAEATGA